MNVTIYITYKRHAFFFQNLFVFLRKLRNILNPDELIKRVFVTSVEPGNLQMTQKRIGLMGILESCKLTLWLTFILAVVTYSAESLLQLACTYEGIVICFVHFNFFKLLKLSICYSTDITLERPSHFY